MIYSMTGYAHAIYRKNGLLIDIELRSVNSRFFDCQVKLSKQINDFENRIRELLKEKISRGSIIATAIIESKDLTSPEISFDYDVIKKIIAELSAVRKKFNIKGEISLDTLLRFPELIINKNSKSVNFEAIWPKVQETLLSAIIKLNTMRAAEGKTLRDDLMMRIDKMKKIACQIENEVPKRQKEYILKLKKRIQSLLSDVSVDQGKLANEISFIADKMDITEEIVRFKSHLSQFEKSLNGNESVGKRLGFLLQEMNREANTIGSKANHEKITGLAITLKEDTETIREQIANID